MPHGQRHVRRPVPCSGARCHALWRLRAAPHGPVGRAGGGAVPRGPEGRAPWASGAGRCREGLRAVPRGVRAAPWGQRGVPAGRMPCRAGERTCPEGRRRAARQRRAGRARGACRGLAMPRRAVLGLGDAAPRRAVPGLGDAACASAVPGGQGRAARDRGPCREGQRRAARDRGPCQEGPIAHAARVRRAGYEGRTHAARARACLSIRTMPSAGCPTVRACLRTGQNMSERTVSTVSASSTRLSRR
ncbi:hypothetical protein EDD27_6152 [Nonomuraea polychroma]|uniref:Uncharacterized protein n=1 Tax=Nonomuraea polychroma TaxID=46176 RepID=A0A438MCH6_9ACTN|nr:hypothetical protein EDD27_6152 [Nonomuraea polychroma]